MAKPGFNLWVKVLDEAGAPIPSAKVTGTIESASNEAGDARSDVVWVTVEKDGYTPYVRQPYTAPPLDAPIPIHLAVAPPDPPDPGPEPPEPPDPNQPTLADLSIRGHCFQTDTLFTARQCSDFNLLNRWQHGEDVFPVLAQRRDAGFNLLRVWTSYAIDGIGVFLDIDYGRLPEFIAQCAAYNLRVEFTAYTGINDPQHWPDLCDAARLCHPRPLIELVNELDQNTNEPDPMGRIFVLGDYDRPEGLLCSHGSNGSEQQPVSPFWDYVTFHTNGASEEQRKVGHNAMEIWAGPSLTNETSRYPDVGMWRGANSERQQDLAFDSSAGAALLCAGSCFHSVSGKTSTLWDEATVTVARAWVNGSFGVDLNYQDGIYRRQEPGQFLRVYQRYYTDARGSWTVEIRK